MTCGSPTGRTSRPRRRSAATTCSRPTTWTPRSSSPARSRRPSARSRSARCWSSPHERVPDPALPGRKALRSPGRRRAERVVGAPRPVPAEARRRHQRWRRVVEFGVGPHDPHRRRDGRRHRRAVRRDEGGARRLLPRRGPRPGRRGGHRRGRAVPARRRRGPAGAGSRVSESEVAAAVAEAHRREWGYVLAATVRVTRDLDLAEECVQDAYAQALRTWAERGIPGKPAAWLTTAARNRALDLLRRAATFDRLKPLIVDDDVEPEPTPPGDEIPDDRLRLICTCCHPALAPDARVALTLRLLCGLTTAEVARAFLVSESTMAARITRAKKKIAAAGIPYRVPAAAELPARMAAVLAVVHLVFTTGHAAPVGDRLRRGELVERALDLARILRKLRPDDADGAGLLALILLTDARRATRVDERGDLLLLADQDRAQWDRAEIAEGVALVREALRRRPPGRFALQAAIAAVHAESPSWEATDWAEVVALYDLLEEIWPSPVVALNRAVAVGFARGFDAGLAELDALAAEPQLAGYGYLAAARADFLRRAGRAAEARTAYEEALMLTENQVERRFLERRLTELPARPG